MIVLMIGRYAVLDKLIKIVIVILATSTIVAVVSAFGASEGIVREHRPSFDWSLRPDIIFLIAFIGWMPAPLDVTVWQSLWTLAKQKAVRFKPSLKQTLLDFKIGYIGTAILALAFLALGALVMYGTGEGLSHKGAIFAEQLIAMYTENIGRWSYLIIGIAALTTMYSTTLTVIDAYPRVMRPLTDHYFPALAKRQSWQRSIYWFWIIIIVCGTLVFIGYLSNSMRFMVDLATTLSFITAPILALLNYRVVTDKHMPEEGRPAKWMKVYAWTGIIFLSAFTIFYIFWRLL
jgi:Mn2+/Fe2+ NRAMP family transporter